VPSPILSLLRDWPAPAGHRFSGVRRAIRSRSRQSKESAVPLPPRASMKLLPLPFPELPPALSAATSNRCPAGGYPELPSSCSHAKRTSVHAESHVVPASSCPDHASLQRRPGEPPCTSSTPSTRRRSVVPPWPFSSEPTAMARSFDPAVFPGYTVQQAMASPRGQGPARH
jgi:hypothetical protein